MKNNVLEQAKIIIEKRREIAEKNASENKLKALSFPDFKTLYSNYISLIIDNAILPGSIWDDDSLYIVRSDK